MYFFGAVTGYIIISTLADNLGRKLSLIICIVVGTIGYSVMIFAYNLVMAGVGDFMAGFSSESCFYLMLYILEEMMEN